MAPTATPPPFPWGEAMALGFGRLRLSPSAFWGMTPRELAAAAGRGSARSDSPARAELQALMARFPDTPPDPHHKETPPCRAT